MRLILNWIRIEINDDYAEKIKTTRIMNKYKEIFKNFCKIKNSLLKFSREETFRKALFYTINFSDVQ